MDEDLKIVLTSELEADEQASAQRISAQLPSIAKLINSKSTIKVGVTLDSSNIQGEAQKISRQITQATKTQGIGVTLNLDQGSVAKIRQELNSLRVSPDISRAMTDQLDKMGIQIDRITGRWQAVNGEEERMLNLTIQGTDQMQRTVTYLQTYDAETGEINTHLTNVTANLERQRNAQEQLAKQAAKDNESRVSYLTRQQAILADIQATYAGATSVKPIKDDSHLETLNSTYKSINAQIQNMISAEGRLDNVQRSSLETQISNLQRLVKEYQNAEYVATKLRTKDVSAVKSDQLAQLDQFEQKLKDAGVLTKSFQSGIEHLRVRIASAFDAESVTLFLNKFDSLQNHADTLIGKVNQINNLWKQLGTVSGKITAIQQQLVGLDTEKDVPKIAALERELALYQQQGLAIGEQIRSYGNLVTLAQGRIGYEQQAEIEASKLAVTEAELAVKARECDTAMQGIPVTIADLNTKLKQVVEPTKNLKQNWEELRKTAAAYNSDMGDKEKIQTYERIQGLIKACSKEMNELLRVQRGDVNNFKFTQGLEKAKADLATVGRTWSALKKDPGLNAQFQQLEANLRRVNNQMDLNKWTAQFSAFKSEVKAAGRNMQSLGDILKNNIGKVLQWVSATTLLFRAFRLLRQAISTIVELDTAMIDLRKTTTATETEYRAFYSTANDTAKALGVTTEQIISQTAEWSRLGYTIQEAATLAKNSAIFKAVSPGMDVSMATDGLVSIIKAFDIDVNDSMDGIISKVNAVGNAFAVSNKDIVEAMTRSSSAMASANNTFDETVALATAAIEITRDASSVGNGLKTLSMRIRGYDEETEEFSEDLANLTGEIADLTKVASNGNRGISLFEPGDPDTYRSTYDILKDIADIWDELTDKNRAQLLEALFGKRQAQIGSAILSNFEQASAAMKTMEASAGSADREMEKITNSLEYKLNALKETWVGVAQNLFQTDDLKVVVDALTAVSGVIDTLTDHLGLFGSVGLVTAIALIVKFRSAMASMQATVLPVVNTIKASGVAMDGSAASVQFYATKLMGLDKSQQAAAMSALGLNTEQKKQVATMSALITSAQRYTIQELAEKASTDKATASALAKSMAKATEKRTTEQLSAAMMVEILNSNKLTAAQKQAIIASLEQSAANEAQAFSWKAVGANAKAALAAMATNPMTWVMLAVTAVMALVQAWQNYKQAQEEARQAAMEAADSASTLSDEIVDLTNKYLELSEAVKTDQSVKQDLLSTQDELIKKLDLEKGRIEELTAEYGNLTDAIKAASVESLQRAERDLRGGLSGYKEELLSTAKPTGVADKSMNHLIATWGSKEADANHKALNALVDAGYISSGSFGQLGMELWLPDDDFDLSTIEGVINAYERLGQMLDIVDDAGASETEVRDTLFDAYNKCTNAIKGYQDSISALNTNLAEQYMLQSLIGKEIPNTEEEFNAYRQQVIDAAKASEEFVGSDSDIVNAVDTVLKNQSQFAGFYANELTNAGEATGRYIAQLQKLPDVLSALQDAYDAMEAAQEDMANGGGLSPDTIEALASAEENYLDYLYEENGVVKLNTEAWKENANAKMQSEMGEIEKEIASLEEQNGVLRENIAYYEEQRQLGSDGGIWSRLIGDATAELNRNNAAIAENQGKLAIYSSLYGSITGDLDAYTSALQNFTNVASTIDTVADSFQTLAELQAEVANGFTMSLDKALEFAKVYPEILNNAQVSADGQVVLNEGVVNSFIQGKKAELDAQIDAEVAKLEADKAVLEAKVQAAQAQLDLAQNVGEGEGQIAKELAEYRINAGNIVAQALIDAGIDEATAFKLAAAAMAQNAEEFDRVAMEVCTDVNGNFNQAAYAAAQAVYNNMTQAKLDVASFARQCQEAAKAMAGVAGGQVAGSSGIQGGSGGGVGGSGISLNLTSGSFQGTDYNYTAKQTNLDDFISQIQLDISSYQSAIAQIDGQIATLRALKNIPLKDFKGGLGSGGGSGGSGGGGSSKEVEEYIADIDAYREAIERLRKAQQYTSDTEQKLDNTDDLKQRILLERQLIGAYAKEQDALHNLNNQRDSTITAGAEALRKLGFEVQYNADTNELWISNMEHLNELQADSVGEYGSLQEATNALRKDTEGLIKSLEDLNDENRDASQTWWDLKYSMQEADKEILQLLEDIVAQASEAVDSIQDVYDTLHSAADEYAESGYVTVDTLQSIIDLGLKYVTYLMDENGQLVINEERIRDVIAAKTQQLAIESALSYVEALRIARQAGDTATLNDLLYATQSTTDATWGLVYANLALAGLDEDQYQAALANINAIRALADNAIHSIGQTGGSVTDELNNMKDGLDDILKYVMDMLKQRINEQIDALEDMKDAYSEIIDKKKESLQASKDEADYSRSMSKKLREIAKLHAQIDALSLDDSREAQAEKAKLLEEMAELQEDVAEKQADKSLEATESALDDMEKAYHDEKDKEIAILEDSISSYQKLYDMAIEYIQNNWDTLYSELIAWNTQYGDVLNSEITTAWDNCLAAAQRYGDYVSALKNIGADIDAAGKDGKTPNTVVGETNYENSSTNEEMVHAIIKKMYANSQSYFAANDAQRKARHQENVDLAAQLAQYGIKAVYDNKGSWYVDKVGGELLYDKFKKYTYHSGGIAGDGGTLKDNEILAKLEKGEPVLTAQMWENLTTMFERMNRLASSMGDLPKHIGQAALDETLRRVGGGTVNNVTTSNQPVQITIGDTIIEGNASPETVKQHAKVSYDMVEQISRILKIRL